MKIETILAGLILLVSICGLFTIAFVSKTKKKQHVEVITPVIDIPLPPPSFPNRGKYNRAYGNTITSDGPQPGEMMGVPVPAGTLKSTNDRYNTPFIRMSRTRRSDDFFRPYGSHPLERRSLNPSDRVEFVGSADAFAPIPEVGGGWEKIGLFIRLGPGKDGMMNAYRRPIAPQQDLFEYTAQTRDGFIIRLENTKFLEDGDRVSITGKPGLWRLKSYVNDKYVWV